MTLPQNQGLSFIRVRLRFLRTDEGGRKFPVTPSSVMSYRPNARIKAATSDEQYPTWLTEKIQKIALGEEIDAEWILSFSNENPYSGFESGAEIEFFEGNRVVARGHILKRFNRTIVEWQQIRDQRNGTVGGSGLG
jgi:hypothetical protein